MQSTTGNAPYIVQYQAYDPRLPAVFETVKQLIQAAASAVPVEHIGSSAIPGVGGRNVLDIAIPMAESAHPTVRDALLDLGFEEAPFPHYLPLLVGQIAHEEKIYPILLYLVEPDADVFAEWIRFRDYDFSCCCAHPGVDRVACGGGVAKPIVRPLAEGIDKHDICALRRRLCCEYRPHRLVGR